jgi:5-methylcytosine-specific restriction endonuclease McrA
MNICLHCNKQTNNPKFCSRSCAAKETNKVPKRKAKQRTCISCGDLVGSRRTKCDACLTPKDMNLEQAIYFKHHKSSAFALVRSRARACVKKEEQVCESCGYDTHVEVCHIKPINSFPLNTLLTVINSRDNLKLLCPNCHWEFDNLSIKL